MAIFNTEQRFGSVAKFFHWIIGLWVIGLLIVGFLMVNLPVGSFKGLVYAIHKSSGLTILALVVLRFCWRQLNKRPLYPADMPVWQAKLATFNLIVLYALLFIQPITGWVMSTASNHSPVLWWVYKLPMPGIPVNQALASFSKSAHMILGWTFVAIICLHIVGALDHWWIRRDGIFERMLPDFLKKKQYYDTK